MSSFFFGPYQDSIKNYQSATLLMSFVASSIPIIFRWFVLMFSLTLASCQEPSFEEKLLADGFSYSYGISVADLTNNGRMDIVAADAYTPDHADGTSLKGAAIYLFQNMDDGFIESDVTRDVPGPKPFRNEHFSLLERNALADLDGDGLKDLAVIHLFQDRVMAFRNPGTDRVSEPWPASILFEVNRPVEIKFSDVDGRKDALVSDYRGGVWWARNNGTFEGWKAERIAKPDGWGDTRNLLVLSPSKVIASDLKAGEVGLFTYDAGKWSTRIIASGLTMPWHGDVVDWNRDNKPDIVFGDARGIHVLLNGETWTLEFLTHAPTENKNARWFEVKCADMDGDGDIDLVASRSPQSDKFGGEVWVFENVWWGWKKHLLKSNWGLTNQVQIADLNNDGKPDFIVSTEQPDNEVRYWLNRH